MSAADQDENVEPLEVQQSDKEQSADKDLLYEKGRRIIWVIEIKSKVVESNVDAEKHITGFSLECNGSLVIITRAREFDYVDVTSVRARRFNGTFKTASSKLINFKLDLAMLQIDDDQETNEYGELALDGSLSACQHLIHIGNLGNSVGSSFVGRVCFPCKKFSFDMKNYKSCKHYISRKMGRPMKSMVLGDLIQPNNFVEEITEYDEKLNAYVPIIQCSRFPWMRGSEGSPIFNLNEKIVGMLCIPLGGCHVVIHVVAIKAFLNSSPPNEVLQKREQESLVEEDVIIAGRKN